MVEKSIAFHRRGIILPGSVFSILLGLALLSSPLKAALLEVHPTVAGPTPEILAYNLGNFHPGSNTTDWWRYARVSGARMFMPPSHFETAETARPGEVEVTTREAFLTRREALRADPLNTAYIAWPKIEERFGEMLPGNNRIVPQYAYEQIHRHGGQAMAQMTLNEGGFPIADDDDWAGKWIAWRVYYSLVFYLAREFDVQRFTSHNEPNHTNWSASPAAWLMRARLASDAVQSAIEDVNRIYGKQLTPIFVAPVTAGAGGAAYNNYGRLAVQGQHTNFLGETNPSNTFFHLYAYQQYNRTPASFASSFRDLRDVVNRELPATSPPLRFTISEYNVHTGAAYDGMMDTADALSKATRFAAIGSQLMRNGLDELYAFKFGMTAYPSTRNFPVQKNGLLYTDNRNEPFGYGTMTRSAEGYRLFNKAFAPGRERLEFDLSGSRASDLEIQISRDPTSGFYYVFSVNETSRGIPFELDVSRLDLPEGNHLIVEDVSQWRRGVIRSMHRVENGRIKPGRQPGRTIWLISIPSRPQARVTPNSNLLEIPVSQNAMVKDGSNAATNYAGSAHAWARNDPADANERSAVFLQYDLPDDWDPTDLQLAIVELPVAPIQGGAATVHAHLYGIDNHDWGAKTLTWQNAPNLRKNAAPGDRIRHGVVQDAGYSAHVLAQITASGEDFTRRRVDVTDYLIRQRGGKASFLLAQDPRWDIDIHVAGMPKAWTDLDEGDRQPDGLRVLTEEGGSEGSGSRLILLRSAKAVPASHDD